MLERLVPVVVACAETHEDAVDVELFAVERAAVGHAVAKRRDEFVTGRACARRALQRLGAPVAAIPNGPRGAPLWPAGVVGSITHCAGFRACAVAWADTVTGLGIDAEPNAPLPGGVLEEVAHGRERDIVGDGRVDVGRLLFSAKEAVYKAWFPLTARELLFEDVELAIDVADASFRATLLVPGPVVDGAPLRELHGRWAVEEGIVCTAVVVGPTSR